MKFVASTTALEPDGDLLLHEDEETHSPVSGRLKLRFLTTHAWRQRIAIAPAVTRQFFLLSTTLPVVRKPRTSHPIV